MQSTQNHWEGIGSRDEDADSITDALDDCRAAVVDLRSSTDLPDAATIGSLPASASQFPSSPA
jgi:hypothetical protein